MALFLIKPVFWKKALFKKLLFIVIVMSGLIFSCWASAGSTGTIGPAELNQLDIKTAEASFSAKPNTLVKGGPSTFMFTAPNIDTFEVMPVRFEPEASFLSNAYQCGLIFSSLKHPQQMLTTIGIGETEALSCNNLVALGALTAIDNEIHVGLIYENRSPNATFQDAMIVSWSKEQERWYINQTLMAEKIANKAYDNLWALQKALLK